MPFDEKQPLLDIEGLEIIYTSSLKEVIELLEGKGGSFVIPKREEIGTNRNSDIDFQQIIGIKRRKGHWKWPLPGNIMS